MGAKPTPEKIVFLRLEEVLRRMGIKKTKLYAMMRDAENPFPKQTFHGRAAVWAEHEVTEYQRQQLERRK